MSEERDDERTGPSWLDSLREPAARNYLFVGFTALIVYYLLASEHDRCGEIGALLTLAVAIPGLLFRWVLSPALFLILLTYLLMDRNFDSLASYFAGYRYRVRGKVNTEFDPTDCLFAAAVITYLTAFYRMMSFVHKGMPEDPPPRRKGQPEPETPRRPFHHFADRELLVALGLGALYVLLGAATWLAVEDYESRRKLGGSWGVTRPFARLMLFLWAIGTATVLAGAVFRYLKMTRMTRPQARLVLQDSFWEETRREQERIQRWRRWYANRLAKRAAAQESK